MGWHDTLIRWRATRFPRHLAQYDYYVYNGTMQNQNKTSRLSVVLTPEEKHTLKVLAHKNLMNISQYIVHLINQAEAQQND